MNLSTRQLLTLWPFKFKWCESKEASSEPALSRPHEQPSVIWPLSWYWNHSWHTTHWCHPKRKKGANGPAWVIVPEYNAFNLKPRWSHWVNKPQTHIPLLRGGKKSTAAKLENKDELIEEDEMVLCENWGCEKWGGSQWIKRMCGWAKVLRVQTKPGFSPKRETRRGFHKMMEWRREGGRDED